MLAVCRTNSDPGRYPLLESGMGGCWERKKVGLGAVVIKTATGEKQVSVGEVPSTDCQVGTTSGGSAHLPN